MTAIFTFLLFKPSNFLWENLPLLSEINYPWIVLGILGFLVSLLAGFLCREKITKYIVVCLGIISVFLVLPYAKPQYYVDRGDDFYLTNDATTTSSNELMPLWVRKIPFQRPASKIEIVKGQGNIKNIFYNSKQIKFSINALSQSMARINTIYFPGWKAYVDKVNVPISYANELGVMDISIPSGDHAVHVSFGETPLRLISDTISLSSVFILLFLMVRRNKYAIS